MYVPYSVEGISQPYQPHPSTSFMLDMRARFRILLEPVTYVCV